MHEQCSRLWRERSGLTVAELLVTMAIMSMVLGIIVSFQISAMRWSRRDEHTAVINRPLREATSMLARDVEFAAKAEVVSGELVLTRDRRNADGVRVQDTITYYLDAGVLSRSLLTAEGASTEMPLTSGLGLFEPSITAQGLVRVRFVASSFGSD